MQLKDLLREHARKLGGNSLTIDNNGTCHLMVNDDHLVTLEEVDDQSFFLYSEVAPLPSCGNEPTLIRLLQANLYGRATQGCVFALDAQATHIILFKEFRTSITDFPLYLEGFEIFLYQLAYWKSLLQAKLDPGFAPEPSQDYHKGSGKWIKS